MDSDTDCQPSSSVGSLRTVLSHAPPVTVTIEQHSHEQLSTPSSPRSSALPSPPDSPISTSSLPSMSSSFFFSSRAPSPPHNPLDHDPHPHLDPIEGLIIPSLSLPEALRRPTPFGQTLGDVKLILIGTRENLNRSSLVKVLLDDNEDVVDIGGWEHTESGRVLHASTYWVQVTDRYGLDKFEPARNVEILEVPYDLHTDPNMVVEIIQSIVRTPYHSLVDVVDPDLDESYLLSNLLSSTTTPLYTAAILISNTSPNPSEYAIINDLSHQVPLITLPRLTKREPPPTTKLAAFRPSSLFALKNGIFRSPDTLLALRSEAADRFLHWRSVERTVESLHAEKNAVKRVRRSSFWDKAKWEAQFDDNFSRDVARRRRSSSASDDTIDQPHGPFPHFDPLHVPSLVLFSLSLLGPLASRIKRSVVSALSGDIGVKTALVGGFCLGFGVSLLIRQ